MIKISFGQVAPPASGFLSVSEKSDEASCAYHHRRVAGNTGFRKVERWCLVRIALDQRGGIEQPHVKCALHDPTNRADLNRACRLTEITGIPKQFDSQMCLMRPRYPWPYSAQFVCETRLPALAPLPIETGKATGPGPGYVIDHVTPLKRGGADSPSNMQWQTTAAAKAKDGVE